MAVAYKGTDGAIKGNASGSTSIVCPRPSGIAPNDLMIIQVSTVDFTKVPTAPAGWTVLHAVANYLLVWRIAGSAEPSGYSFGIGSDSAAFVLMNVYTGHHLTAPISVSARASKTSAGLPITSPAVTATFPGGIVHRGAACLADSQTAPPATPAGHADRGSGTSVSNGGNGTTGTSQRTVDIAQGSSLAVPSATWATTGTNPNGFTSWGTTTVIRNANTAPNAPTLGGPTGGVAIDRAVAQRFTWTVSDPDGPTDAQSKYDLRYRQGLGAYVTVTGTTPNAFHDFAAGTFAAGDYEWSVRTYDAQGFVGPYSASAFYTAANVPAAPTITTPGNNTTVARNPEDVAWSYPTQQQYQVRRVADLAGAPDPSVIYSDTGLVTNTEVRGLLVAFPVNNRVEHVQVRVKDVLLSPYATAKVTVSYTAPQTPTLVLTPTNATASIAVGITNPAPAAGEPAVVSHDLYRREGGAGDGVRIAAGLAPGATYTDRTPGHGVDYSYRAVSLGDNGTSATGAWTA